MKRRGKNLSNLQEFAKSINYLQTHKIETMEDLQERIDELNGVVSVSKKEIEQNRCAMACQGCGAVFLSLNQKAVETKS